MSTRRPTMIDVREVLRRWAARQSTRKIARETERDRKTVGDHRRRVRARARTRRGGAEQAVVHEVAQRVQARPLPDASEERVDLRRIARGSVVARAEAALVFAECTPLLVRDHGLRASYDTLRRFAIDELGWRKEPDGARRGRQAGRGGAGRLWPDGDDPRRRGGPSAASLRARRHPGGEPLPVRVAHVSANHGGRLRRPRRDMASSAHWPVCSCPTSAWPR